MVLLLLSSATLSTTANCVMSLLEATVVVSCFVCIDGAVVSATDGGILVVVVEVVDGVATVDDMSSW